MAVLCSLFPSSKAECWKIKFEVSLLSCFSNFTHEIVNASTARVSASDLSNKSTVENSSETVFAMFETNSPMSCAMPVYICSRRCRHPSVFFKEAALRRSTTWKWSALGRLRGTDTVAARSRSFARDHNDGPQATALAALFERVTIVISSFICASLKTPAIPMSSRSVKGLS